MTIEADIYNRLSTHTALTAVVSTRIYFGQRPQNDPLPAVTFMQVSSVREYTMGTGSALVRDRWQVSCWANDQTQAAQISEIIRARLNRWRGTATVTVEATYLQNTFDDLSGADSEERIHHRALDFEINYLET
jgi:Protein of unknown function (DUF3168).